MDKRTATGMLLFLTAGIIATYIIPALLKSKGQVKSQIEITQTLDSLLQSQSLAWNQHDLDGFMSIYQKSDSLLFISKNSTNLGWQQLYDIYKKKYFVDTITRGRLFFTTEKVRSLSADNKLQLLIGKWRVEREQEILNGKFSLIFSNTQGDTWEIITDHTW